MKHCLVYVYIRHLNTHLTLGFYILSKSLGTQTNGSRQIYHNDYKPSDNTKEWQ